MKGRPIPWYPDELAWIEANAQRPRSEAHAMFCARFDRSDVSRDAFSALCKRKGWLTGHTGRIEPGNAPFNKGKPMPFHPNSARTQFQKGARPHTWRGAGHERIDSKDGYVVLIVDETNPWTGAATRPVHKHRWLWEKANGPLPSDHVLKCLDGDKTNTDPANWEAIPRGLLPRLNGRFGRSYDDAEPEVKPLIMAAAKLKHRAQTMKRGKA